MGRPYDKDGEVASKGKVDDMLMARLKEHDFFKRPIPRRAWCLDFGSSYLDHQMEEFSHLSTEDLLATLTEFAAYAITRSITGNVKMPSKISVITASGRSTWNHYLTSRLQEYMPKGLRLTTSDEFGVPAEFRGDQGCDACLRHGQPSRQQHTRCFRATGLESLARWCSRSALQREQPNMRLRKQ